MLFHVIRVLRGSVFYEQKTIHELHETHELHEIVEWKYIRLLCLHHSLGMFREIADGLHRFLTKFKLYCVEFDRNCL